MVSIVEPDEADAIAQSLLRKFGSLGSVLSAPSSLIADLIGNNATAALLSVVKSTVLEGFREDIRLQIFDLEDEDFLQYIVGQMQGQREEILHAIFLDNFGRYLSDEIIAHGTWSEISVRLRSLLRRAIEVNCAKLVLFHNHPSGDCRPSNADVEFTLQARPIAGALGIDLFDHLVVSGSSVFSMRRAGLLT